MERDRRRRRREQSCFFPVNMSERVTQLTRFHNLADAEALLGSERRAELWKTAAVSYGLCVLMISERDRGQKEALEEALEWLRSRDYEMHKKVSRTFEEAHAKRFLAKRMSTVALLTRSRRQRRR